MLLTNDSFYVYHINPIQYLLIKETIGIYVFSVQHIAHTEFTDSNKKQYKPINIKYQILITNEL